MKFVNSIRYRLKRIAIFAGVTVFLVVPGLARCSGSIDGQVDNHLHLTQSSSFEDVSYF